LHPQKELILFRIVQELLTNIIRHARARTISVSLNYGSAQLLVTIRDDGTGFDRAALGSHVGNGDGSPGNGNTHPKPESSDNAAAATGGDPLASEPENPGLGIKSMYHRAQLIGADFQLTSTPGAGTTAAIRIPYPQTPENPPQPILKNSTL
jgi:two-component system sensor histidine kinase DegS